jgi:Ca2+-binding RTX toxin-like protein
MPIINAQPGVVTNGSTGDDTIYGVNFVNSVAVNDTINGNQGNDLIYGYAGNDILDGESGSDTIYGGIGNDSISGGGFSEVTSNQLFGEAGNDTLNGADGSDTLDGGDDNDVLFGQYGADRLLGGNGADSLQGGLDNDTLIGGVSADGFLGGDGSDSLDGGAGDDTFVSTDTIFDNWADAYNGGVGWDAITVGQNGSSVVIASTAQLQAIEEITNVSPFGLSIISLGNSGPTSFGGVRIQGTSANNLLDFSQIKLTGISNGISGGAGNDTIIGSSAATDRNGLATSMADLINGEAGNDVLEGGKGDDTIRGGADFDIARFAGNAADFLIVGYSGPEGVGRAVQDLRSGSVNLGRDIVIEDIEALQFSDRTEASGTSGNDTLAASTSAPWLINGLAGNDSLNGNVGNDTLNGGDGNDTLKGGTGTDMLFGGAGADSLDGGADFDYARYDDATGSIRAFLYDPSQNYGDAAGDSYLSVEGIIGSGFSDDIRGDAATNVIFGLDGDDFVIGLGAQDYLYGGNGYDIFHFVTPGDGGATGDVIQDFASAVDRISIWGTGFGLGYLAGGGIESWRFAEGTAATYATSQFIFDAASGQLWYDQDGTGAGAKALLATLQAGATMAASDFLVL